MADKLEGKRILITGPTGQVALPVTRALAADNDVIGLARFRDPAAKAELEALGVTCLAVDLAAGEFGDVPDDVDYVLNLAVVKSNRWEVDLRGNAEAAGLLMAHCRNATAFLHCSSTGVYAHAGSHQLVETDPLGDNHRVMLPTYSIAKIATEAVVRTEARQLGLPTTIARLNVPYGENGGWPLFHLEMMLAGQPVAVHPDRPNLFNPIHEDDIIATIPALLAAANVPATIVNWGGDQQVALEEWVAEMGRLVGIEPTFEVTEGTIGGVTIDNTKRLELLGPTTVDWHDGIRRMIAAQHPELLQPRGQPEGIA
jgi:nucleoside-diphosphate-sugar epimerase